jgi:hypothetical protein
MKNKPKRVLVTCLGSRTVVVATAAFESLGCRKSLAQMSSWHSSELDDGGGCLQTPQTRLWNLSEVVASGGGNVNSL